ncbi:MAG TPA: PIN domain-containing protein [Planctomycetota bacterium]|nr:PIN domain-containing protein [Planctomycetota bacterium]HRR79845.1 PIN domain-containing protein [Planctomycetota bacterium]HRT92921.1 PIN domain-containing protein [Planctomycetota bacterium]
MKRVFVDSNIFLRLFTHGDPSQHERSASLFADAERGDVTLVCGPPVLFEVAWTLRSFYRLSREELLDVVARVLATPGLELTDRPQVEDALRRARAARQEFADAYIAASLDASGCGSLATFSREHFAKLGVALHSF